MRQLKNLLGTAMPGMREPNADEYIGEDGLLWCKKCGTPRRRIQQLTSGDYAAIPIRCACEEAAFKRVGRDAEETIRRAQADERRKLMIPCESYRGYRFENDDGQTPEVTAIAKRYAERFADLKPRGWGVVFCGSAGTGKTFLAMSIANALIDAEYAVRCVTPAEIIAYAQDFDRAEQHFRKLMATNCIVVDDLGTERLTDFGQEQLFKFFDGCYVNKIPTVITTNYMKRELQEKANGKGTLSEARIYDRILQRCTTVKLESVHRRAEIREQDIPELNAMLRG